MTGAGEWLDLSGLSTDQLLDRWTPTIFLPRSLPRARAEALRVNVEVERVLATRGICRDRA